MALLTIYDALSEYAGSQPNAIAIRFNGEEITRKAFLTKTDKYQSALGLHYHGKKIAILLPTTPSMLALFVALMNMGCEVQVLNYDWPTSISQRTLVAVGSELLICEQDSCAKFPNIEVIALEDLERLSQKCITPETGGRSLGRYTCFTSGSTGNPKGCVRTETSWLRSFLADQPITKLTANDNVFIVGSFAHSLFLYAAVRALYAGAILTIFEKFHPQRICQQLDLTPSVVLFAVPTQIDALVYAAVIGQQAPRNILTTGSKLPVDLVTRTLEAFINTEIIEFYGTSELSYVSARVVDIKHKDTFVGWPITGVKIDILDELGQVCRQGEVGFVFIESPMIFEGYVVDGKTSPFKGAFIAGDTGFIDATGGLHLIGRGDRMFQSSGRNIIPEEIESALLAIDGIDQAAILPVSDNRRGNRILSVIRRTGKVSQKEIKEALQKVSPQYSIPNSFLICNSWPRTVSHKTDYMALAQLVLEEKLEHL